MPHVCLNAIVKNEGDKILRMLDSYKGHISTFAILDTGSTDDTVKKIHRWSEDNLIKGIVRSGTFNNFSQARNDALDLANEWHLDKRAPWFDYILLGDADMEFKVKHESWAENLTGDIYTMEQIAGGIRYQNARLVRVHCSARYVGATHEYLSGNMAGDLTNAFFIDHADGSNRTEKYARDIRLLEEELAADPENQRTWFYLGNSYREAGEPGEAITCYRKRASMHGGFEEERWHAQMDLAHALLADGQEDGFVREMLKAYQQRPSRVETLFYLARFYREKPDMQQPAILFALMGLNKKPPEDRLFIPQWIYEWGLREEVSILGCYAPEHKLLGYKITNSLALDPKVPEGNRQLARSNMAWYLPALKSLCPSFEMKEINFLGSCGWTAMNPSVCARPNGTLEVILRTVNYTIDEQGRYMIGDQPCGDTGVIETENWLCALGDQLEVREYAKIKYERPAPLFDRVLGLEDMRLWWHRGERHFSATVREQSAIGQCEMRTGVLRPGTEDHHFYVTETSLMSDPQRTEKNWMPIQGAERRFMYNMERVYNHDTASFMAFPRHAAVDNIRGSSQMIEFGVQLLGITHEAIYRGGKRAYQHRFVLMNKDFTDLEIGPPFVFEDVQIEFCAGLATHPDRSRLVISFGLRDEKAMLGTVEIIDVLKMFGKLP